jgi:hypothetical protein
VGGVALEAFFSGPRNVYVAANGMKIHGRNPLVQRVIALRKPRQDIFSRELANGETVPKGQVDTTCRYFTDDFDEAFTHVIGLSRRERITPSFYSDSQLAKYPHYTN